jgi:signal transduction histidine kinase
MNRSRRPSFRGLLRAWIFGYTFLAVALSTLFFLGYANSEVNRHLQLAEDMVQLYADDSISIEFGRGNLVYVRDSLQRLSRLLGADRADIRDSSGMIAASTNPSEVGKKDLSLGAGTKVLSALVREHSSGERLGTVEIYVNKTALMASALRTALLPAIALLVGLLVLSAFVMRSLRRRLIRPIGQMLRPNEVSDAEIRRWPREIYNLSERLQEALQERDFAMIGQFSSGILHDVNTKIHSINSAKELIDELPLDSPKRPTRLEGLYRACSVHIPSISALIEATLDGNRQIRIQPSSDDLGATIKEVITQYQEYAQKRGVELEFAEATDGFSVAHDGVQLERAISNILKNGIESFDKTDIAEKRVLVSLQRNESSIEISIEDNGPGLTFSPSTLLRSVRTTKVHGTGLGLLVTRKIVEAHGGTLRAGASTRLSGAEFTMTLPVGGAF